MHAADNHSEKQSQAARKESEKGKDEHARVNHLLAAAADILADTIVPREHQIKPKGEQFNCLQSNQCSATACTSICAPASLCKSIKDRQAAHAEPGVATLALLSGACAFPVPLYLPPSTSISVVQCGANKGCIAPAQYLTAVVCTHGLNLTERLSHTSKLPRRLRVWT